MTDLRDAAQAIVERTTRAQGLPFHVTDPTVLARTAALLAPYGRATNEEAPTAAVEPVGARLEARRVSDEHPAA